MTFIVLTTVLIWLCAFFISPGVCVKGVPNRRIGTRHQIQKIDELPSVKEAARKLQNAFSAAAKKGSIPSPGPKDKKQNDEQPGDTTPASLPISTDSTIAPSPNLEKAPSSMPSNLPSNAPSHHPSNLIRGSTDLFEFSVRLSSASFVDGEALADSLQRYLTDGMQCENLGSIILMYTTISMMKELNNSSINEQIFVLDGTAYFDGYAPSSNTVLVMQDRLLTDSGAVQDALHSNPKIPDSVQLLAINKKDGDLADGALQSIGKLENVVNDPTSPNEHESLTVIGIVLLVLCTVGASALLYMHYLKKNLAIPEKMGKNGGTKHSRKSTATSSILEFLESAEFDTFVALQTDCNSVSVY